MPDASRAQEDVHGLRRTVRFSVGAVLHQGPITIGRRYDLGPTGNFSPFKPPRIPGSIHPFVMVQDESWDRAKVGERSQEVPSDSAMALNDGRLI